jgi:Trypsin-co-occurring domain 2
MRDELIPLSAAIKDLRRQLAEAVAEGEQQSLRFELGPIELELQIVASREAGVEGNINFKIFGWGAEGGGDGKLGDQRTQKLKLIMKPIQIDALGSREEVIVSSTRRTSSAMGAGSDNQDSQARE